MMKSCVVLEFRVLQLRSPRVPGVPAHGTTPRARPVGHAFEAAAPSCGSIRGLWVAKPLCVGVDAPALHVHWLPACSAAHKRHTAAIPTAPQISRGASCARVPRTTRSDFLPEKFYARLSTAIPTSFTK